MTSRRAFLRGLTGFVACAPAIVKASSLMPVKALKPSGYRVADYLVGEYTWVHMSIGYAITAEAIETNLFSRLFTDPQSVPGGLAALGAR